MLSNLTLITTPLSLVFQLVRPWQQAEGVQQQARKYSSRIDPVSSLDSRKQDCSLIIMLQLILSDVFMRDHYV
jgi:hypothetical protein